MSSFQLGLVLATGMGQVVAGGGGVAGAVAPPPPPQAQSRDSEATEKLRRN
jgi:hypothetical protein